MWKKIGIRKPSNDPTLSPSSQSQQRTYKRKFPMREITDSNKLSRSDSYRSFYGEKTEFSLQSLCYANDKSIFVGEAQTKNGQAIVNREVVSILKKRTLTEKVMNSQFIDENLLKVSHYTPKKQRQSMTIQMFHNSIQKNRAEKTKYPNSPMIESPNVDRLMEEILKLRTQLRKVTMENNLYKTLVKQFKTQFKRLSFAVQTGFMQAFKSCTSGLLQIAKFSIDQKGNHPQPVHQNYHIKITDNPKHVAFSPSPLKIETQQSSISKIMNAIDSIKANILKRVNQLGKDDPSIKDLYQQQRKDQPLQSPRVVTFNKILLTSPSRTSSKQCSRQL